MKRHMHHDFNAWLDAGQGGPSTSPSPASADSDLGEVQRAARQIHDLARHAERPPADPSLPATWEEFMSTHSIAAPPQSPAFTRTSPRYATMPSPAARRHDRATPPASRFPIRWNALTNLALAAVLILAVGAGAWRATDGFGFAPWGDGPAEPTSIPFGSFVEDGTPDPGVVDPANLPKAEDCTIEPLTVDEVLWYIQEPIVATRSIDPESSPLSPFPFQDPATPPATNVPPGPASQADLDGMVETQRMWMACVLADSPFQVWATMSPEVVGRDVERQLPPLTSVEEARAMLEALEHGTYASEDPYRSLDAPLGSTCGDIVVISADPDDSFGLTLTGAVPEGTESRFGHYTVRYTFYDEAGNPAIRIAEPEDLQAAYNDFLGFIFRWNDARQAWLLESFPSCG